MLFSARFYKVGFSAIVVTGFAFVIVIGGGCEDLRLSGSARKVNSKTLILL